MCAVLGLGAVALFGVGKFVALGLGILAVGLGWLARRNGARVTGTLGAVLGGLATVAAATKIALTLIAISALERL